MRETWEEAGVVFGRPAGLLSGRVARTPIEQAYLERGLVAAMDLLTYVGRAITPSHSPRRFNTRFFLGEGGHVVGEPAATEELEDVRWHPIGHERLESFRDVTRFMLARALALRAGTASDVAPLFYWAKNARRVGVCREAETPG
jgi:8-oxo-dGTP pyrophosphatase MutT (NUDIX family)